MITFVGGRFYCRRQQGETHGSTGRLAGRLSTAVYWPPFRSCYRWCLRCVCRQWIVCPGDAVPVWYRTLCQHHVCLWWWSWLRRRQRRTKLPQRFPVVYCALVNFITLIGLLISQVFYHHAYQFLKTPTVGEATVAR